MNTTIHGTLVVIGGGIAGVSCVQEVGLNGFVHFIVT
jgi:heterodisulfide reductase subunit A-like polyferredoxin